MRKVLALLVCFLALPLSGKAAVTNYPLLIVPAPIQLGPGITVARLPAAASWTGAAFLIQDGASSSDCVTGAGTSIVLCRSNGTSWTSITAFATGDQLLLPDGTAAAPSYSWTNETGSGIYRAGAGQFNWVPGTANTGPMVGLYPKGTITGTNRAAEFSLHEKEPAGSASERMFDLFMTPTEMEVGLHRTSDALAYLPIKFGTFNAAGAFTSQFQLDTVNNQLIAGSGPTTLTDSTGKILSAALNTVAVANGGTGLVSGTSGGIPYFSGATSIASSALLTANALVLGGGAGVAPTVVGSLGSTTTVLHGAAGAPTFGAVVLTTDVSGILPTANGGTASAFFTVAGPTVLRTYTFRDASVTIPATTDNLSVFAATTSAQLAGVLSDETGTGVAVFGTAPTFITSITAPTVYGGTAVGSTLTLAGTSNGAPTNAHIVLNGAGQGGVGIGTATPNGLFTIAGSSAAFATIPRVQFSDTSADGARRNWAIYNGTGAVGNLEFFVSAAAGGNPDTGTRALSLTSAGVVGIGTATVSTGNSLQVAGHIATSGTAPTAGACGTSPGAPSGTDNAFSIVVGTGPPTSCVINFAATWASAPICSGNDATTTIATRTSTTTTAVTVTAAFVANDTLTVLCTGKS